MTIKQMPHHYSMENPASIYDEEAMSALELAGRTAKKVNETVEAFNQLEKETNDHLNAQDDAIPEKVENAVQRHINEGDFDKQIDKSIGNLTERVDNLVGSINPGSTTLDAEIIDARVDIHGNTHENAGNAMRENGRTVNNVESFAYIANGSIINYTFDTDSKNHIITIPDDVIIVNAGKRTKREYTADEFLTAVNGYAGDVELTVDMTAKTITTKAMSIQYDFNADEIIVTPSIMNNDKNNHILIECFYESYCIGSLITQYHQKHFISKNDSLNKHYQAYMGDGKHITVINNDGGAGGLKFQSMDDSINIRRNDYISFYVHDVFEKAKEYSYLTVDEANCTITGATFALVYNFKRKTVEFRHTFTMPDEDILVLFHTHYKSIIYGALVDSAQTSEHIAMKRDLATLSANAKRIIPDYFYDNINNVTHAVRCKLGDVGRNGESFVFITDPHWNVNHRNSPALIEHIVENTNVNTVICGGDLIGEGLRDEQIELLNDCVSTFKQVSNPLYMLFGNHDSNWNNWNDQHNYPERRFDSNDVYGFMFKQLENRVTFFGNNDHSYYFDNASTQTRFICLDSGEDGVFNSYDELHALLKATPEGYHIIIFVHWLINAETKSLLCNVLEAVVDGFNAKTTCSHNGYGFDFTNAKGEIVYVQSGHTHYDSDWTSPGGVPFITTDGDTYNSTTNHEGNINGQCFDVVTIDYATRVITMKRVGRGSDRTYSY